MDKIKLGVKAKDVVTGFTGTITSITKYLTGCDRVNLTPDVDEKGAIKETCSFDITSVEYIDEGCAKFFEKKEEPKTGGPEVYLSKKAY